MQDRQVLLANMLTDKTLPAIADLLVNVSRVTNAPDPNEVPYIAALIAKLHSRFLSHKIAIVNDRVGHATISHLIATLCSGDVRAYLDETSARKWLNTADR